MKITQAIKKYAKKRKKRYKEMSITLIYGHILNDMSKELGFHSWNHLCAYEKNYGIQANHQTLQKLQQISED